MSMTKDFCISHLIGLSCIIAFSTKLPVATSSRGMRARSRITILEKSKRLVQCDPVRHVFTKIFVKDFRVLFEEYGE
jgi:hypothetical protein